MAKTRMGRWSMFRDKLHGEKVHALITKFGKRAFETRRQQLARLYREVMGEDAPRVSDADVIEFLARGELRTRQYFEHEREN